MRVAFDGRSYFRGGTGDRTYFRELLPAMLELAPQDEYTLYCREPDDDRAAFVASHPRLREVRAPYPVGWLWNQGAVAPRLKREGMDLYQAQYLLPAFAPRPMVVSIHDLTFRLFPAWNPPATRRKMNLLIALAARVARKVITISENSRRDLVRCFKLPPEKIVVTPLGVSPRFQPMTGDAAREVVARRYGLDGPYLAGVGLRGDRKNPGVVVRAMRRLQASGHWPRGMRLALAGEPHHFPDPEVQARPDEIAFLGYVADDDLPAFYNAASACVYPSHYEGFGIPPLEAMACGCPVLASNTSSLPEVVGDAGFLLPPSDDAAWAGALNCVLRDERSRHAMRARGLAQAAKFTWEDTARRTLAVYREVCGGR